MIVSAVDRSQSNLRISFEVPEILFFVHLPTETNFTYHSHDKILSSIINVFVL